MLQFRKYASLKYFQVTIFKTTYLNQNRVAILVSLKAPQKQIHKIFFCFFENKLTTDNFGRNTMKTISKTPSNMGIFVAAQNYDNC